MHYHIVAGGKERIFTDATALGTWSSSRRQRRGDDRRL
jgi:hypothetical protein